MPATNPKTWGLYLITDQAQTNGRPLLDVIAAALRGGVRAVQLRERALTTRALLALAEPLRRLTSRHGAALLINNRIDVALACDADGVHLPADSFSVTDARALLGPIKLIGASTHSAREVSAAAAAGADFVVFGPIYDTPSKRPFGPPLGLDALADARASATVPLFGIGGIDAVNAPDVLARGADGVAVIRAILAATEPEQATRRLLQSSRHEHAP